MFIVNFFPVRSTYALLAEQIFQTINSDLRYVLVNNVWGAVVLMNNDYDDDHNAVNSTRPMQFAHDRWLAKKHDLYVFQYSWDKSLHRKNSFFCLRNAWTTTIVRNTIILAQEKGAIGFRLGVWFCFILDGKRRDLQSARLVWCWLDASQHETHQTSTWYIRQQVDVCLHKISLWPGISLVRMLCTCFALTWFFAC